MDINFQVESLIPFLKVLFVLSAVAQLLYFAFIYSKIAFYKARPAANTTLPPVSVVIAARNEFKNLSANLQAVLAQDYPDYEVVVVNDGSRDDTQELLEHLQKDHKHLQIALRQENDKFDHGKKLAITLGIKRAKHDRLLFTDADCRPVSKQWIRTMMGAAESPQSLVLGHSPFRKSRGFLNALIRFSGMYNAMNYLGFALSGMPYMGVGRNLSYSKAKFFEVGGFKRHYSLPSGDDDLFVNEIANKENTRVCIAGDAGVLTDAKNTWKEYWRQKRRHLSTGWRYKGYHKVLLALQPATLLLLIGSGVFLMVIHSWLYIALCVMVFRMLVQILIFRRSSRWLGNRELSFFAPLLELMVVFMTIMVHIANATTKKTKWKT